jgi:hypothetical protein
MTTTTVTERDLRLRERTNVRPGRAEVTALLAQLRALGVDPPPDADRAMLLVEQLEHAAAPPDVRRWVAGADLSTLDADAVLTQLRRCAVQQRLAEPAGRALLREVADALTARAVAALAGDVDRLLVEQLRPSWDAAAAEVHAAARTGLTGTASAETAVALGEEAVTAWRTLGRPAAVLTRIARARALLAWVTDRELAAEDLAEGWRAWLDRAAAGPPALTVPSSRRRRPVPAPPTGDPGDATEEVSA